MFGSATGSTRMQAGAVFGGGSDIYSSAGLFSSIKRTSAAAHTSYRPAMPIIIICSPPTALRRKPPTSAATICGRHIVQLNRPR